MNRLNAYTILPAGYVPIAVVRIQAAATEIMGADIQDVRELAYVLQVPDSYGLPAGMASALGGVLPALGIGAPLRVMDLDGVANVPRGFLFLSGIDEELYFRKLDGTYKKLTWTDYP